MSGKAKVQDIGVSKSGHVATVELQRPPNNFLDVALIGDLASVLADLDGDESCRAIVLASAGKHFCAGANLGKRLADEASGKQAQPPGKHLYHEAIRLFQTHKPIIAAVHGAAVGAGLGLALAADFRVGCSEARFSANFVRQGYHPGFGMTCTLPRIVGEQKAAWLFYTGERIDGDAALAMGMIDRLVPFDQVRSTAQAMAQEIADSAPLAVMATRATLRRNLEVEFGAATHREFFQQTWLRDTADYKEGVKAMNERRMPNFKGV
jgi:enoyl-CoA hydratase/carnithine racemase